MCNSRVLKGWFAALVSAATIAGAWAEGVVIGPKFATTPDVREGELLLSELNCAACHRSDASNIPALSSRESPLLGKKGIRITPQYLRAFLQDPAAAKPGTTMPNMLHHLGSGEKKETVEALVHFLVSEQEETTQAGVSAEEYLIQQGRTLYHTVGCVACHEPQASAEIIPGLSPDDPKMEEFQPSLRVPASVPLGDLATKTTVEELSRFLVDPLKVRPSGRMPSLNLTGSEARSIAVYLLRAQASGLKDPNKKSLIAGLRYQYYEESFGGSPDFDAMTPKGNGSVENFDLKPRRRDNNFGFRYSGIIQVPQTGTYTFFSRSDDGSMLYIDGKLVVDNNGEHAPAEKRGTVQLTEGNHSIVATFYNSGAGFEFVVSWQGPGIKKQPIPSAVLSHYGQPMVPLGTEDFAVDRAKATKGRQLFSALGCASCHQVSGVEVASVGSSKALNALQGSQSGCLAENPGRGLPKFDFSGAQRKALASALEDPTLLYKNASPQAQINRTLASLSCYACHTRDGKGGPENARLAYFRVVGEMDMGDEGRIPPHLTGVGGKLRPEWIHEVLLNKGSVRPYMATRMPQFGAKNLADLPGTFEKADVSPQEKKAPETTQRDSKFGRRLAGTGGLSCIACHTVGKYKSLGIPAINLAVMSSRLRYDWFTRYLIDPPSLRPGTRMPSFWPNGEAANQEILDGDTAAQIRALWAYLESKPEADVPPGLVQGRMELVAETEPIIYRNFILGAGPRAIGIGYPEKVNLAFDANQVRLAMIWQGAFIDGARHRSGRGEGFEPPLGNNVVKLPEGPEFAILPGDTAAWPTTGGRNGGYKMGGYSLDEKRRPTFFYSFNGMQVEEAFEPIMGEIDAYFKRTIRLTGTPAENLWFRAATGNIVKKGETFVLDGRITFKFPGAKALLRGSGEAGELLVPIKFTGNEAKLVEEIIW